jgi:hypothetical protein
MRRRRPEKRSPSRLLGLLVRRVDSDEASLAPARSGVGQNSGVASQSRQRATGVASLAY